MIHDRVQLPCDPKVPYSEWYSIKPMSDALKYFSLHELYGKLMVTSANFSMRNFLNRFRFIDDVYFVVFDNSRTTIYFNNVNDLNFFNRVLYSNPRI